MRIALLQEKQNELYDFHNPQLFFPDGEAARLASDLVDRNLEMLDEAGASGADLAVTSEAINFPGRPETHPELSADIASSSQEDLLCRACSIAAKWGMSIVLGMLRVDDDERLRNSTAFIGDDGKLAFWYDKQFLAGGEREYMVPGTEFPVLDAQFGRVGAAICWDMQFPEVARVYARQRVDLVVCPTWGWESAYASSRALENGIYVASAMAVPFRTGIKGRRTPSQVLSPLGDVMAEAPRDIETVLTVDIPDIRDCGDQREMRMGYLEEWMAARDNVIRTNLVGRPSEKRRGE